MCKLVDISECFHVSYDSVKRYVKKLEQLGENGFFTPINYKGGGCSKLLPKVIVRMQKHIDDRKSNSEIARLEDVTGGSVRYAIKTGKLKKKTRLLLTVATEQSVVLRMRKHQWELRQHGKMTV
jgi:hypothetical protein